MSKKILAAEPSVFVEEYLVKPVLDQDGVQATSGIGRDGKEYPDPTPLAPPVGYAEPPDMIAMIRRMVQSELGNRLLDEEGLETFEESDDFDIEDDPIDPLTPYERVFEAPAVKTPPAGPQEPAAAPPSPVQPQGKTEGGAAGGSPDTPPRNPPGLRVQYTYLMCTVLGDTSTER